MTTQIMRYGVPAIEPRILTIRGKRVMLDSDLAAVYGVETKALNKALKRNRIRFPEDFSFQLTRQESTDLRFQIGTSNSGRGGSRYRPHVFTEHGAIMAATILNSPRAVRMSVFVVRAFVKMRALLSDQGDLARKLATLEKALAKRLDLHEQAITEIVRQISLLLESPKESKDQTTLTRFSRMTILPLSVVIPRLQEIDAIVAHQIDDPMLVRQAS